MLKFNKGFTLVELIVVITILAILGTLSFISFQGYSKDARDAKRITDTRNLIGKINIEQTKGIPIKDLITNTIQSNITIDGKKTYSNVGIANFEAIKESGKNFKDPLNDAQDYPIAYSEGTIENGNYNFIQVATISERNNVAKLLGNYYKIMPGDSPSLFKIGELFVEDGKNYPLPYNPRINEDNGIGQICIATISKEGYTLSETDNDDMVIPTPKKDLQIIENGKKIVKQNYKCDNGMFILDGVEITDIECKSGYVKNGERCEYNNEKIQSPNTVGDLNLVNESLGNEESYLLDTSTGLKWQVKVDTKLKWAINNSFPEPIWNGSDYDYNGKTVTDYPAFQYCRSLGARWRIPTLKELISIAYYNTKNSYSGYTKHPNIINTNFWTSQQDILTDTTAYVINFFNTDIHSYPKDTIRALLCVHDDGEIGNGTKWIDNNIETSSGRLVKIENLNGTGAFKDTFTNLNWQKDIEPGKSFQWATNNSYGSPIWNGTNYTYPSGRTANDYPIFNYCTDLGVGWRVPSRRELLSIATLSYKNQNNAFSIHPNLTPIHPVYWTSEEYKDKNIQAWGFHFNNISTIHDDNVGKGKKFNIICVHD